MQAMLPKLLRQLSIVQSDAVAEAETACQWGGLAFNSELQWTALKYSKLQ